MSEFVGDVEFDWGLMPVEDPGKQIIVSQSQNGDNGVWIGLVFSNAVPDDSCTLRVAWQEGDAWYTKDLEAHKEPFSDSESGFKEIADGYEGFYYFDISAMNIPYGQIQAQVTAMPQYDGEDIGLSGEFYVTDSYGVEMLPGFNDDYIRFVDNEFGDDGDMYINGYSKTRITLKIRKNGFNLDGDRLTKSKCYLSITNEQTLSQYMIKIPMDRMFAVDEDVTADEDGYYVINKDLAREYELGQNTISIYFENSVGNQTNAVTTQVYVYKYEPPTMRQCGAERCQIGVNSGWYPDDSGEYIRYYMNGSVFTGVPDANNNGTYNNTGVFKIYWAHIEDQYSDANSIVIENSDGASSWVVLQSAPDKLQYSQGNFVELSGDYAWKLKFTVEDSLMSASAEQEVIIPISIVTFELLAGGKGAAFGKAAEHPVTGAFGYENGLLDVNFDALFRNKVRVNGGLELKDELGNNYALDVDYGGTGNTFAGASDGDIIKYDATNNRLVASSDAINLTSDVSGFLPPANGGVGEWFCGVAQSITVNAGDVGEREVTIDLTNSPLVLLSPICGQTSANFSWALNRRNASGFSVKVWNNGSSAIAVAFTYAAFKLGV